MKKTIVLLLTFCLCIGLCACGDEGSKGNLNVPMSASGITNDDIAQAITENGWCNYVFSGQQRGNTYEGTMEISSIEITKRMTDDHSDTIWAVANMADDQFSRKSFLKITYLNYTQGGWLLETIERNEPSVFTKIGKPQSEECEYLISEYFNQYTLESVDGDGIEFVCSYVINENHKYCDYTGNISIKMNLNVANQIESTSEYCYWDCSIDVSGVVVDWTKACGNYSCMDGFGDTRWEQIILNVENKGGNSLGITGVLTDETLRDSNYGGAVGASWPFACGVAALGKIDSVGVEPNISISTVLGAGEAFNRNYRWGYDDVVEKFLRYNDNKSSITVDIHPDYIEFSYSLTYHNNYTGEDTYRVDN